MMKKGILYVVSAVLLGVALMLTPLRFLSIRGIIPAFSGRSDTLSTKGSQEAVVMNELAYEVTPHYPADEISIGLMSTFSLVLAFAVFKQYKKRTA